MGTSSEDDDTDSVDGDTPAIAPRVDADLDAPPIGSVVGRYIVERRLAGGGMGVVYRANDPELNRAVAIKLLRPPRSSRSKEEARLRLLREAQALARVTHPNVIAVYDVGSWRDRVFVAMELVEGATLADWVRDKQRTPRQILEAFADAARALAATHRAGLVHRDFKPSNVMIGNDGRVRVLDFGLARLGGDASEERPPAPPGPDGGDAEAETPTPSERSRHLLEHGITIAGQVVGTPAFMAPEQHRGQTVDARADQFSFCASLYWALYKQVAFEGDTSEKIRDAICAGIVAAPPQDARVPLRVRRMILRGLSPDAAARHPSMDAIARELDAHLHPSRRWIAVAAVVAGIALSTGMILWQRARSSHLCRGLDAELAGVWNLSLRRQLHAHLVESGRDDAEDTFAHVARALDDYASGWVKARQDACEATQIRGVQSARMLDLRMSCLGRARDQLGALVHVFAEHEGKDVLEHATGAALSLPGLGQCSDETALLAAVPLPDDPKQRAEVQSIESATSSLQATYDAGLYRDGLPLGRALRDRAAASGYAPVLARAEYLLGCLIDESGDAASARTTLSQAATRAAEAKDDALAAHAWIRLFKVIAVTQAKHDEAALMGQMAHAAVIRAGKPPLLEGELAQQEGSVALESGRYGDAERLYRHAVERFEQANGAETDAQLPAARGMLAAAVASQGRYEEARPLFERALADGERVYGPEHMSVANVLTNLGLLYARMGQLERSRATLQRGLRVYEATVGSTHPRVAMALNNLAGTLLQMGREEEALADLRRAVAIWSRPGAPENPDLCYAETSLASALTLHSDFDEATTVAEEARRRFEKTFGPAHPDNSYPYGTLADILAWRGRYAEAQQLLRRALELQMSSDGDVRMRASTILNMAGNDQRRGQPAQALAQVERARTLLGRAAATSDDGETIVLVARALEIESDVARARGHFADALALAQQAFALRVKSAGRDSPSLSDSLQRIGRAELGAAHPGAAEVAFERAASLLSARHPALAEILIDRGSALLAQSRDQPAIAALERAASLPAWSLGPPELRARQRLLLARAALKRGDRASWRNLSRQAEALFAQGEPGAAAEERHELSSVP